MHIYIYIYIHTYIHMHIHTQMCVPLQLCKASLISIEDAPLAVEEGTLVAEELGAPGAEYVGLSYEGLSDQGLFCATVSYQRLRLCICEWEVKN